MKITPLKTNDSSVSETSKTLLIGHHGAGKTSQIRNYEQAYGKGFVISGESGLASVSDCEIDYLPFKSFESPCQDGYSFKQIAAYVMSDDFRAQGYKWICIDSATELSQQCFADVEKEYAGSKNGFEKWGAYSAKITESLKWVRDLPYHVLITCLATEETDDNGQTHYWPMLVQNKVQKMIPALYDHVFCLIRATSTGDDGSAKVKRYLVTDEVRGWHGKTRDPHRRLKPVEDCDDVTELLRRVYMTQAEYENFIKQGAN